MPRRNKSYVVTGGVEGVCIDCGRTPRRFPEDREILLCRCDTTPEEWSSGHLIVDAEALARRMFDDDGRAQLRVVHPRQGDRP